MHYDMERGCAPIPDMVQCIDVALIYIEKGICRKFHRLMGPTAPLVNRGIQLCDNYLALL